MGTSVIIEWGTWSREERDALRTQARKPGVGVSLCVTDADDDELWRRVCARGMEDPPISREQITRWRELFESPSAEERSLFDRV